MRNPPDSSINVSACSLINDFEGMPAEVLFGSMDTDESGGTSLVSGSTYQSSMCLTLISTAGISLEEFLRYMTVNYQEDPQKTHRLMDNFADTLQKRGDLASKMISTAHISLENPPLNPKKIAGSLL